jgi:ATP-binding cassette subfamily F protein uup
MITGSLAPDMGKIVTGQTIVYGYYSQEGFQPTEDKRVIDLAKDIAEEMPMGKGRISASAFLAHFNFPQELQYNYFSSLSGGEKRRLFLLMQLLKNPNFLILDEPTNDLDIHTLNLLEDFLMAFEGCLLVVSHDRYFMDKIVDHVFVFEGEGKVKDYYGNYTNFYREKMLEEAKASKQKQLAAVKPTREKDTSHKAVKPTFKQKTEFEALDVEIQKLEALKHDALEQMNSGEQSPEELEKLSLTYQETEVALEEKTNRWLELSELFD